MFLCGVQEFSRASDGGPTTTETKWRLKEERYQSEAAEEGRHYLDKPVTLMLLSPVVVVVCVLLFLIYFLEELGFIKNIEKERKKEKKKLEIRTHCCSSSSSISTILFPVLQKQFCVDSTDERTEIFELQSVCSRICETLLIYMSNLIFELHHGL